MDLPAVVDILLAAIAGLFVGSFLTMVVDRVPDGLPLFGRPRCPHCSANLGVTELVPVASWLSLRGKCRHCDHPITPAYPAVEIVTAALFVAVSVVDLYDYRIPDRIVFPTLAVSVPLVLAVSLTDHDPNGLIRAVIGAVLFAGILFVTSLMPGGGMGFGDVKLALVLGFFLGYVGSNLRGLVLLVFAALLIGSLLGVVMGLAVGALRTRFGREVLPDPEAADGELATRSWSKQPIPFGPSLALATVVAVLFSNELLAR